MRRSLTIAPAAVLAGLVLPGGSAQAMPGAMPWDHAGGPGRPDCTACHFDSQAVTQSPALVLSGLPDKAEPGRTYDLVLRLKAELAAAGFLLRAETHAAGGGGAPVGRFQSADKGTEAGEGAIRSTVAGARPAAAGLAEWRFSWAVPAKVTGPVMFYVAAVAADDDRSPLGDRVHLRQIETTLARQGD